MLHAPVVGMDEARRRTVRYREAGFVRGTLQPRGRDGSGERFLFHLPAHSLVESGWILEIEGIGYLVESVENWPQHGCLVLKAAVEGGWR